MVHPTPHARADVVAIAARVGWGGLSTVGSTTFAEPTAPALLGA